jgi:hypothetical protein
MKVTVLIDGITYTGHITEDHKFINIYDVISIHDCEFMGRYELDGKNIVANFPMSNTKAVIGCIYENL